MSDEDPSAASTAEAPSMRSLLEGVKLLVADLQGALQDRLALLGLELRLAAKASARLLALAVVAVLLMWTVWALLIAGLFTALVMADMSPLAAIGLLIVLNLAGAALAGWLAWRCVHSLTLPATVRRLRDSPLTAGAADEPADRATPAIG